MGKPALGNRPTPPRSRQPHASTANACQQKAQGSDQHGTQEGSLRTGVLTGFGFLSPLFLLSAGH